MILYTARSATLVAAKTSLTAATVTTRSGFFPRRIPPSEVQATTSSCQRRPSSTVSSSTFERRRIQFISRLRGSELARRRGDGNDTNRRCLLKSDTMIGGEGNDSLSGIFTNQASGGDGNDTINANTAAIFTGTGTALITLDGGLGNDLLIGNTNPNCQHLHRHQPHERWRGE